MSDEISSIKVVEREVTNQDFLFLKLQQLMEIT